MIMISIRKGRSRETNILPHHDNRILPLLSPGRYKQYKVNKNKSTLSFNYSQLIEFYSVVEIRFLILNHDKFITDKVENE
jgi:hypothetical protein